VLKSLIATLNTTVRDANFSAHELSAIALSFERYRQSGQFLIDDSYLETRLAAVLTARDDLSDFALFGMDGHLRCLLRGRIKGQDVEATIAFHPIEVHWDPFYRFVFNIEILRWEVAGTLSTLSGHALRMAVSKLIPLGGLLNIIGQAVIDKTVKSAALAKLATMDEFSEHGVTWDGSRATLDLSVQPGLSPIFLEHGGERVERMMSMIGTGSSIASQIKIQDITADRTGLLLKASLSPPARASFSTAAKAFTLAERSVQRLRTSKTDAE